MTSQSTAPTVKHAALKAALVGLGLDALDATHAISEALRDGVIHQIENGHVWGGPEAVFVPGDQQEHPSPVVMAMIALLADRTRFRVEVAPGRLMTMRIEIDVDEDGELLPRVHLYTALPGEAAAVLAVRTLREIADQLAEDEADPFTLIDDDEADDEYDEAEDDDEINADGQRT